MKTIQSSLLLIIVLAIGLFAPTASAITITWNAPAGSWHVATNWNPAIEPGDGNYNADVVFNNGGSLDLYGSRIINTYNQSGGNFATHDAGLQLAGNSSLAGGGTINLSNGGFGGNAVFTVTNGTIRGFGEILGNGVSLVNGPAGIIQADVAAAPLDLSGSGPFTNNGLMRALNGGRFRFGAFGGTDVINNGTIRAENGSQVEIYARIVGGTLDNAGSSGFLYLAGGVLRNVTIGAGSTVTDNNNGRLEDSLVNLGTLSVPTSLRIGTNTTLTGAGTIALTPGTIYDYAAGQILTNTNNTIRGNGNIGYPGALSLVNGPAGIVQADVAAQTLALDGSGTFTNNGLMRATNGGRLQFNGSADVMNNSTIRAENGSQVEIYTRIVGGTLDNAGSNGRLLLSGGVLRNVTIGAGSTVTDNNNGRLEDSLVNLGTLSLADGNSIRIGTNTALTGGGTIALTPGTLYDYAAGQILTNTNNTIRGYGEVGYQGLSLVNGSAGIIQADVSGQSLTLDGSGTFTNNGLFAARNGGILARSSGTFTNFSGSTLSGGAYLAADSTLNLNTAPIVFNAATVVLSGPASVFSAINSIGQNDGTFVITNGRTFGATPLQAGSPKTPAGTVFPNTGTLIVGPNDSTLTITGDYAQGSGAVLEIVLGADYPNANFHHMNVTGSASLAGTLEVKLANGYVPGPGQIEIIRAGAINGGFVTVNGATVTYTSTGVFINATGNTNALQLTKAVSRKTHGLAGALDINLPLTGAPGVECRNSGGNHTLVFTFSNNLVSGNASWTSGTGSVSGPPTFAGKTMTVNLTGVADVQPVTVTLRGLMDVFSQELPDQTVSMKVLAGDTTNNASVGAGDIGQTKGQAGIAVTQANCRQDVTPNGSINASDIGLVKSRSGQSIP